MGTSLLDDPLLANVPEHEGYKVLAPAVLYVRVGQGGMGAVYRGRHLTLDVDVAVKCLKPALAAHDSRYIERFGREAKLAAEISHENLVRVYHVDLEERSQLHYLVMEFVEGETARDRVKRKGPLAEAEAAKILLGAARGLARAHRHERAIVHRDVKPENILISRRGEVKIADLGIAKAEESVGTLTSSNVAIGTPQYMAPEQWDDAHKVGPPADVWALGATLYFLLTGENAVRAGTMQQICREICDKPFPDVRVKRPKMSEELRGILVHCVEREPEKRYPDAVPLAEELERFVAAHQTTLVDSESGTVRAEVMVSPPPSQALKRIRARLQVATASEAATRPVTGPTRTVARPDAQPRRVSWRWAVGALLGSLGGFGAWRWLRNATPEAGPTPPGPPTIVLSPAPDAEGRYVTRAAVLDLVVRVAPRLPGETRLELVRSGGSAPYVPSEDGTVALPLVLEANETEEFELVYGSGKSAAKLSFEVVQDSIPPVLTVLAPAPDERRVKSPAIDLRVRMEDENPRAVQLDSLALVRAKDDVWEGQRIPLPREGENDLVLSAEDLAGNRVTEPLRVVLDSKGPQLDSADPAQGSTLVPGSTLTLRLAFDEEPASVSVGGAKARPQGKSASVELELPDREGPFEPALEATDDLGNRSSASLAYTLRAPVPERLPAITLDRDLGTESRIDTRELTVKLMGTVAYAEGGVVLLSRGGKRAGEFALDRDGRFALPDLGLKRNQREAFELAYGSATLAFDVVQDSEPPVLEVVEPAAGARRTRADAFDLVLKVTEPNLGEVLLESRALAPGPDDTWVASRVGLPAIDNRFTLIARDRAGNERQLDLVVVRDTQGPRVAGGDPVEGSLVEGGKPLILVLTFDEPAASAVLAGRMGRPEGETARFELDVPPGEGPFEWTGEARDELGNLSVCRWSASRRPKPKVPDGWEIVDATSGFGGWAKKVREPKSGIELILVAPGRFQMGSPAGEEGHQDDETQHAVELTKAFYLGETEVTQAQYERVVRGTPSNFKGPNLPVETVSWTEADVFCRTIGCELPTEAQWEYACRAGALTPFSFGATISTDEVNYNGEYTYGSGRKGTNRQTTVAVKSLRPNAWGFYEMHGNVWEWCRDGYRSDYLALKAEDPFQEGGEAARVLPPRGAAVVSEARVLRGGSWSHVPVNCRSAHRNRNEPSARYAYYGFRVARTIP